MGIDLIRGGRIANRGFKKTKSSNAYIKTLIKVFNSLFSFTLSFQEEHNLDSIKLFTNDLINQDLIDILSHSQEL